MATVIASSGGLMVQRAGATKAMPIALRAPLFAGDVVSTGPNSGANILFEDGSSAKMRANTRLEIFAPAAPKAGISLFRALAGEIWARLRPGRSVKTLYTNLVVRGTEFNLLVAGDTATLTVIEGEVGFSNRFGAVSVLASQQSVARPDGPPTQPVTIANSGLIIEWTLDLENIALPLEKTFAAPRDALFTEGDALFAGGKYEAALARYQQGADTAASQLRRGYALLQLGRLDEANTVFRALAANNAATSEQTQALTGLAWTYLKRNRLGDAQTAARQALGTPEGAASVEAHLALGVALLRQNKVTEAEAELRSAANANPVAERSQARAWLALSLLARSQNEEALKEARAAVAAAPKSALAQTSLATVGFFAGQPSEAARAAKLAAALSPNDMAAQLALGQAKLATGDVDAAAKAAARATALDPQWPQAHYLLGIADAARRDYVHAARSLQKALEVAPEFFPATAALARVYVKMGREKQGLVLLDDYEKAHVASDVVWAARGEVLYNLARYDEAMKAYREAIRLRPSSALNYAGLARVALEANYLTEAMDAGERAVALASDVGAYHSILGLAYQFSRLDSQAERSFRTALALDPNNALALVQLGIQNKEGDIRSQQRTSALISAQGFILDPAVSRDLLRGGIFTEITPVVGDKNQGGEVTHRAQSEDGNLNVFGRISGNDDDGDRPNSDSRFLTLRQDTTFVAGPKTNLYVHAQRSVLHGGLPGRETNPVTDDRSSFGLNQGILAARHRLGSRAHLWAGGLAVGHQETRTNFGHDQSLVKILGIGSTIPLQESRTKDQSLNPELRLDYNLSSNPNRPNILSVGAARLHVKRQILSDVFEPNPFNPSAPVTGQITTKRDELTSLAYAQWQRQVNARFSVVGQLRGQRTRHRVAENGEFGPGGVGFGINFPETESSKTFVLPSLVANYQVNAKTNLRFFANRRVTDVQTSIFAPVGTLLTTEGQALPLGLPDPSRDGDLHAFELDAEHRFSSNGLLKLYAFHSTGRNLLYDFSNHASPSNFDFSGNAFNSALPLDRVRRQGLGARYEHRLNRCLFGQANFSFNRTTASSTFSFFDFNTFTTVTGPAPFNGQTAPYHPKVAAALGLNYVDPRGNKAGINLNYTGAIFADTGDPLATVRPRVRGKVTVDLLLAHEPSVRTELFVGITNLFNERQIVFNGIPVGGRRILVGAALRFR